MKKSTLLLLLLPLLIFASCSKNSEEPETEPETTEVKLKGTWSQSTSKYEFFDEKGTKIHEEVIPYSTVAFDGVSNFVRTYDTRVITGTYTIIRNSSGEFITGIEDNDYQAFKIETISNTTMVVSLETLNAIYYEGGVQKTAAKSVYSSTLIKQ
jgi:hypothetical protein